MVKVQLEPGPDVLLTNCERIYSLATQGVNNVSEATYPQSFGQLIRSYFFCCKGKPHTASVYQFKLNQEGLLAERLPSIVPTINNLKIYLHLKKLVKYKVDANLFLVNKTYFQTLLDIFEEDKFVIANNAPIYLYVLRRYTAEEVVELTVEVTYQGKIQTTEVFLHPTLCKDLFFSGSLERKQFLDLFNSGNALVSYESEPGQVNTLRIIKSLLKWLNKNAKLVHRLLKMESLTVNEQEKIAFALVSLLKQYRKIPLADAAIKYNLMLLQSALLLFMEQHRDKYLPHIIEKYHKLIKAHYDRTSSFKIGGLSKENNPVPVMDADTQCDSFESEKKALGSAVEERMENTDKKRIIRWKEPLI